MLKTFKADLHIHTCLSPCGDLQMTPDAIVRTAREKDVDIIAVTDHNSAENIASSRNASLQSGVTVLAGMEITSLEEAHILAIFDEVDAMMNVQGRIYASLSPGENDVKRFGDQIVVNEKDEVLGFNKRLLITATELPARSIIEMIHSLGGIAIASHIDKSAFSILSQLGFIPEDLPFDALEMSPHISRKEADIRFKDYNGLAWVSSSDAHYLQDIGRRVTHFTICSPTIKEMKLAMMKVDGRKVEWR